MQCQKPFIRHNFGEKNLCKRCGTPRLSSTQRSREMRARTAECGMVRLSDYLTTEERDHLKSCLKDYRSPSSGDQ